MHILGALLGVCSQHICYGGETSVPFVGVVYTVWIAVGLQRARGLQVGYIDTDFQSFFGQKSRFPEFPFKSAPGRPRGLPGAFQLAPTIYIVKRHQSFLYA